MRMLATVSLHFLFVCFSLLSRKLDYTAVGMQMSDVIMICLQLIDKCSS